MDNCCNDWRCGSDSFVHFDVCMVDCASKQLGCKAALRIVLVQYDCAIPDGYVHSFQHHYKAWVEHPLGIVDYLPWFWRRFGCVYFHGRCEGYSSGVGRVRND
ncbi:Uncharacterised protein [Chlamydia trachomatis]|nr:Uncharacterised protein [Chlamydia trachomatis]